MNQTTLTDLFQKDFAVRVDFSESRAYRAADAFRKARNKGVDFEIDECFNGTWMVGDCTTDLSINNWGYIGMLNGLTHIEDDNWTDDELSIGEFEAIVEAAVTAPVVPESIDGKCRIVLGDNLVVSGGVVIITYRSGKQYHLYHNGKATFESDSQTVITEHTFLKDGQQAYERVIVKLKDLESVQSDTNKLINTGDGQVAFVTLYTL